MNPILRNILYWLPRTVGILFALFLAVFSFDVFGGSEPWYIQGGAFLMHSIPTFVFALVMWAAWKHEWVGAIAFWAWSIYYFLAFTGFDWSVYALFSGIPLVLGCIWWYGWTHRDVIRGTPLS